MKLNFEAITLENFGSINAPQTLKLGRLPGLYQLRGRNDFNPRMGANGVGKSTFFRGLTWALYGKGTSGLRTPDIQPWSGKKNSRALLKLSRDKTTHEIVRSTHPNRLLINGREASQEDLDKLVGLSMDMFLNSVLYPQGADLFLDLAPKGKLQLLADGIALERWESRSKSASESAQELVRQYDRLDGEHDTAVDSLEQLVLLLSKVKGQSDEWEEEQKERAANREKNKQTLEKEVAKLETLWNEADLLYDGSRTQLRLLEPTERAAREQYSAARSKLDQAEVESKRLKKERVAKTTEREQVGDRCTACGQLLKGSAHTKHREQLQKQISALDNAIAEVDSKCRKYLEDVDKNKASLEQLEKHVEELEAKADKAESGRNLYGPALAEARTKLTILQEQKEERNPFLDQVSNLKRQVRNTETQLEEMQTRSAELKRQIERTKFWVKGFRDVQLYVLDEVLKEVEIAANAMLPDVGLDGWEMRFDIERETNAGTLQRGLNVSVLSPSNAQAVRWECWSGGEGQRLRLIASLALSEVILAYAGVETNLEALDEPTRGLSREGTADLCAFLAERAVQLGKTTWWVDHQVIESARFTDSVAIIRDKQGTRLE